MKKISFCIDEKLEKEFLEFILKNKFIIIQNKSVITDTKKSSWYEKFKLRNRRYKKCYLYKKDYGEIIYNDKKNINKLYSPIIEYVRPTSWISEKELEVRIGQLITCLDYHDNDGNLIKKDEKLEKDFKLIENWFEKNMIKDIHDMSFIDDEKIEYVCYISTEMKKLVDNYDYELYKRMM